MPFFGPDVAGFKVTTENRNGASSPPFSPVTEEKNCWLLPFGMLEFKKSSISGSSTTPSNQWPWPGISDRLEKKGDRNAALVEWWFLVLKHFNPLCTWFFSDYARIDLEAAQFFEYATVAHYRLQNQCAPKSVYLACLQRKDQYRFQQLTLREARREVRRMNFGELGNWLMACEYVVYSS